MPLVNGSDVSLLPLMSAAYVRSLIPGLALASKCKMTLEPSTLYVPVYATRALNKAPVDLGTIWFAANAAVLAEHRKRHVPAARE
jgi:hypothetical protein